jgi:hypothetical protein
MLDYLGLDEFEEESYEDAIRSGIKSEKDLLERAVEIGFWSKELDEEYKSLEWAVEKHQNAINKMQDKTQKLIFERSTEETTKRFEEIQSKRNKIINYSAESLALRKRSSMLIDGSIYKDPEFKEPMENATDGAVGFLCFNKIKDLFDRDNLIRASYSDLFFESFVYQSRNPIALFEKNFASITVFQSKLLAFANVLLSKLKNIDKIPDSVSADAIKLYNYNKDGKGSKEDATDGMDDLKDKMKKKGKITSEDLLS